MCQLTWGLRVRVNSGPESLSALKVGFSGFDDLIPIERDGLPVR